MAALTRAMQQAMQLMRTGDLKAATQVIQRGLGGARSADPATKGSAPGADASCIETVYRIVPDDPGVTEAVSGTTQPSAAGRRPADEFSAHRFTSDAGALHYKLFIPARLDGTPAPLLIMLHGC